MPDDDSQSHPDNKAVGILPRTMNRELKYHDSSKSHVGCGGSNLKISSMVDVSSGVNRKLESCSPRCSFNLDLLYDTG